MERRRIVVVGSGNVATHLAPALDRENDVVQVVARSLESASKVSSLTRNGRACALLSEIEPDADFYIVAVNDDAVEAVAKSMPRVAGVVAHTSGSVPMSALAGTSARVGVFYPLQTFSREAKVDVERVPFFIEGNTPACADELAALARTISHSVEFADSARRSVLHLAAVFACNFSNYMWDCADGILAEAGLSLEVMRPLLEVTLDKAMTLGPRAAQTGPARRHDYWVMNSQSSKLPENLSKIYDILSQGIIENHSDK